MSISTTLKYSKGVRVCRQTFLYNFCICIFFSMVNKLPESCVCMCLCVCACACVCSYITFTLVWISRPLTWILSPSPASKGGRIFGSSSVRMIFDIKYNCIGKKNWSVDTVASYSIFSTESKYMSTTIHDKQTAGMWWTLALILLIKPTFTVCEEIRGVVRALIQPRDTLRFLSFTAHLSTRINVKHHLLVTRRKQREGDVSGVETKIKTETLNLPRNQILEP